MRPPFSTIQDERSSDDHHQRPGLSAGAVTALSFWPGKSRAVWVRRIGRRQHLGLHHRRGDVDQRAHPIDRPRQCKLRAAETVDEVPAPATTRLLHHLQDGVDASEPTKDTLACDRPARNDAVTLQQLLSQCRRLTRGIDLLARNEAPASLGRRGAEARRKRRAASAPRRSRSGTVASSRDECPHRPERVVGYVTRPDEFPQRQQQLLVVRRAGCRRDLPEEHRSTACQRIGDLLRNRR